MMVGDGDLGGDCDGDYDEIERMVWISIDLDEKKIRKRLKGKRKGTKTSCLDKFLLIDKQVVKR